MRVCVRVCTCLCVCEREIEIGVVYEMGNFSLGVSILAIVIGMQYLLIDVVYICFCISVCILINSTRNVSVANAYI